MTEQKFCRICLDSNVRMHQLLRSDVQDVYEKITNSKVLQVGRLHYACYICYCQLKKCQQLVVKSQKAEELLKHVLSISREQNLQSISLSDRQTYGLVNSLSVSNNNPVHTMEYNEVVIKTENTEESNTGEVIIKLEPDDNCTDMNIEPEMKVECILKQDETDYFESENQNVSGTQTSTVANETKVLVENDQKSFICHDCGATYDTQALLIKHMDVHKPVVIKPNETYIQRPVCDTEFTESDSSSKDPAVPTWENSFKCQYCDYTSARKYDIQRHVRIHTGEKPFKCQYCDYTSAVNSNLMKHIRNHTGEKPYKCQYCNYACAENADLKRHFKTHSGENIYKCEQCNYKSKVKRSLKAHIRTHTIEKPYKCQYCDYTCKMSGHLKIHIRTHTGEKPYKCLYCNYTCAQNGHLRAHVRTHTGEKPYKCKQCSYSCNQSSHLRAHIIRSHTGENTGEKSSVHNTM